MPESTPPSSRTQTLLSLALPVCKNPRSYTDAERVKIFDHLCAFLRDNLIDREHREFNEVLGDCANLSRSNEAEARRRMEAYIEKLEKERFRVVESNSSTCSSGKTLTRASLASAPSESVAGAKSAANSPPFLRQFLNTVAPLCDDPLLYTEKQRSTSFEALYDFVAANLTFNERKRFSAAIDKCAQYTYSDPERSTKIMQDMIYGLSRDRIKDSVARAQLKDLKTEVEIAMASAQIDGAAAGSEEKQLASQNKTAPSHKDPATTPATATEPKLIDWAAVAAEVTSIRPAAANSTAPNSAALPPASPFAGPPGTSEQNPLNSKLRIPKLRTRDLEILLRMPDPKRTRTYVRMVYEPATHWIMNPLMLHNHYIELFAPLLAEKHEEAKATELRGEEAGPWPYGGILALHNFIGTMGHVIDGMDVVFNEGDENEYRYWLRGVKVRDRALTFRGSERRAMERELESYRIVGEVDMKPKTEFGRKLAEDPLFARGFGGKSVIVGKLPRMGGDGKGTGKVLGDKDGEDVGFPAVGMKAKVSSCALLDYGDNIVEIERKWTDDLWWSKARVIYREDKDGKVRRFRKKGKIGKTWENVELDDSEAETVEYSAQRATEKSTGETADGLAQDAQEKNTEETAVD